MEGIMFRETLLESSPFNRKRQRWPMLLAVTLESIVCALLVALPLVSSGVISVAAHPPVFMPLVERPQAIQQLPDRASARSGRGIATGSNVVTFATGKSAICFVHCTELRDAEVTPDIGFGSNSNELPKELASCENCRGPGPTRQPRIISNLAPGSLVYRVEPLYPKMAELTHTRGIVRLHAIIATDGTIQSLNVIDGPPLLIVAARDAVRQWRYRPYILNGQPVEVETMITVNFK
jgi:protein TonB